MRYTTLAQRLALYSVALLGLGLPLTGCSKSTPTLSGGKPVVHWVEAMQSNDPKIRKEAVFKLGNVGPADAKAFPAVVAALEDSDAKVRCEAITALMKFGKQTQEAREVLTRLQQEDPDGQVRDYANRALNRKE